MMDFDSDFSMNEEKEVPLFSEKDRKAIQKLCNILGCTVEEFLGADEKTEEIHSESEDEDE